MCSPSRQSHQRQGPRQDPGQDTKRSEEAQCGCGPADDPCFDGPLPSRPPELEPRLVELISSSQVLMRALGAARMVDPPDWLLGGALIRDRVWNHLHGFTREEQPGEIYVAFFDPGAVDGEMERGVWSALTGEAPDITWDVGNQAAAHLWYSHVFGCPVEPRSCSADWLAASLETATAVGLRLRADDTIEVVAPYGLEDLFNLVSRCNPGHVTGDECGLWVGGARIAERWPRMQIADEPRRLGNGPLFRSGPRRAA
jgi:uncharacterized protein